MHLPRATYPPQARHNTHGYALSTRVFQSAAPLTAPPARHPADRRTAKGGAGKHVRSCADELLKIFIRYERVVWRTRKERLHGLVLISARKL